MIVVIKSVRWSILKNVGLHRNLFHLLFLKIVFVGVAVTEGVLTVDADASWLGLGSLFGD